MPHRNRRRWATVLASILIVARSGVAALEAQLEALAGADLDDVEVVLVCDAPEPAVAELVQRLEGDVVVRGRDRAGGRRSALAEAARAASSDVCIALGPNARPTPGFVAPLAAAVRAGATLAAPVLDTWGLEVHGYTEAADGGLLPRRAGATEPLDALAFDCLAAPRDFLARHVARFDATGGFHEAQLTGLAARAGRVEVVPDAVVRRGCVGPPASVLVATRNRVEEIGACVEALVAHGVLAAGGEVVVVDNGSTDGTDEVVAELVARHGAGVRLVREPVPGASVARNTGAAACRHEVVLLCDDDARPAPGWYEALRDAFAEDGVALAGGPIRALWPEDRAVALLGSPYVAYLSVLDRPDLDAVVAPPGCNYGANWAIRRNALLAVGGFPEDLGISAGSRLNGEEVAVEFAVARLGLGQSRYVAAAAVGHRIAAGRMSDEYLLMRSYRCGAELPPLLAHLFTQDLDEQLQARAVTAADDLFSLVALPAEVDVDDAYAAIVASPIAFARRMAATLALGQLVGAAHLLGRTSWTLADGAVLRLRREHALGHVREPAAAAEA